MADDGTERIEGLSPEALLRAAIGESTSSEDPEAAARAAEEDRRVREDIERHLPDLELLELLGRGGMGHVYRARQKRLGREVAVKVLAPGAEQRASFAERFAREAQTLARLSHPNIVAVHDYGQDGEFCWLVMEFVDGSNLRDVIRAGGLEPAEALALVPKICEALQFAHDQGVVHRDVKPENILLTRAGQVKIADFGLAKLVGSPAAAVALTGTQQVLGTFRYMAPEQLDRPLEVDHRADIYSLGVVFYEMLTGEIPMGRFDLPSEKVATSAAIDGVVMRALEKEPSRRYQHASEVKSDVESAEQGGRVDPTSRRASPKIYVLSVVSAGLAGVGVVPSLIVGAFVYVLRSERGEISYQASLLGIALFLVALIGAFMITIGGFLGFRALRDIKRDWPAQYGVGAAVFGAWSGILLVANGILAKVLGVWDVRPYDSPKLVLLMALLFLVGDAVFLFLVRRNFLEERRAGV